MYNVSAHLTFFPFPLIDGIPHSVHVSLSSRHIVVLAPNRARVQLGTNASDKAQATCEEHIDRSRADGPEGGVL